MSKINWNRPVHRLARASRKNSENTGGIARMTVEETACQEALHAERLARIERTVREASDFLRGVFRISRKQVPHVVVGVGRGRRASVCFFAAAKRNQWAVFFPYCEFDKKQEKTRHETLEQVATRIAELRLR